MACEFIISYFVGIIILFVIRGTINRRHKTEVIRQKHIEKQETNVKRQQTKSNRQTTKDLRTATIQWLSTATILWRSAATILWLRT
jgi:hypothetical protein